MRWKVTKHEHNSNWFYKLGLPNGFQKIAMLISWIVRVRFLCVTREEVAGDFFGLIFWSQKLDLYTSKYGIPTLFRLCQEQRFKKTRTNFSIDTQLLTYLHNLI